MRKNNNQSGNAFLETIGVGVFLLFCLIPLLITFGESDWSYNDDVFDAMLELVDARETLLRNANPDYEQIKLIDDSLINLYEVNKNSPHKGRSVHRYVKNIVMKR